MRKARRMEAAGSGETSAGRVWEQVREGCGRDELEEVRERGRDEDKDVRSGERCANTGETRMGMSGVMRERREMPGERSGVSFKGICTVNKWYVWLASASENRL